ncbi:neutral/alkaline non-lysosomal ceramidase N-terminal domain-containing protein [Bacterioplanoides sp.]|uniref:neutral/alkaline non-lysosomal ceramidase N-terminal domain-containing protein n=1 Tax=Bacterioplanoides sp. TaxID=2066072 RepID=UPI003AFFA566
MPIIKILRPALLFSVLLLLLGCSQKQLFSYAQPQDSIKAKSEHFIAGVGIRDITPPPGIPRAGYALWSTTGEGFRTRLYARAYYMQGNNGQPYALIQTDLMAGSRILLARVAELVNKKTGLHAGNMTITATHTHSSPGQYLGSELYNKHASHKSGFDPVFFEFLAQQLAEAVLDAYDQQVPAKIASGKKAVWGLTRNRSLEPYSNNKNHPHVEQTNAAVFHEINPYMYMVRLDGLTEDGSYQPMGVFMSFAIHGTSIPRWDPMFNGDLWSYFQGDLQHQIEQHYSTSTPVIVGGFEGTHGDIAPAMPLDQSGYIWSKNVGSALAKEGWQLFQQLESSLSSNSPVRIASRHVDIRDNPVINNTTICDEGALGTTLTAGPYEHESPLLAWLPFFKQGSSRWFNTEGCHGNRLIVGGAWIQPWLEPKDSFPRDILFQLIEIGDLAIVPLPFELTAETGFRIQAAVENSYQQQGLTAPEVMVTSLANGYTGYITTPEEYDVQYYEGGHTIYGRYSQPYVSQHLGALTTDLLTRNKVMELPAQWQFRLPVRTFVEPQPLADISVRQVLSTPEYQLPAVNQEGFWAFDWQDVGASHIHLHQPLLSIEISRDKIHWQPLIHQNRAVNDQGYDVSVQRMDDQDGHAHYRAYWYNPVFQGKQVWYRFVVQPRGNEETLYSAAFH